ncbi:MAG: hypothetical protein JO274_02395, partial [Gammaproteobacteria bacterium]|nr:hypothetical protein [Gammaproteobacteria bacterium]
MTQPTSESSLRARGADTASTATPAADPPNPPDFTKDNLFTQLGRMAAAFWGTRERTKLLLLAVSLVAVVTATALMQIRLNAWNRPFYDA